MMVDQEGPGQVRGGVKGGGLTAAILAARPGGTFTPPGFPGVERESDPDRVGGGAVADIED